MELEFGKETLSCLKDLFWEAQSNEQTQELRLGDGMPDVGRVISAWGQSILRSKQWNSDHISCSCGMMIWVLYEPDGEGPLQVMSSWIPFQFRWELPPDTGEGAIRISLLTRFVDARSVSPGKLMVRAGMWAVLQGLVNESVEVTVPPEKPEVPALVTKKEFCIRKEAGEKTFLLDEALTVPDSIPVPKKLISCNVDGKLTDCRVVGDKLAFRGMGNVHMLYQSETGQVHSWDFQVPFSQFAHLKGVYGNDASGDILFAVTSLEPELEENGTLRLKCGMVGQYVICEEERIAYMEDAYHPGKELTLHLQQAEIPVVMGQERLSQSLQSSIPAEADMIPDVRFWPEIPEVCREGMEQKIKVPGSFQVLYYDPTGKLHSVQSKWEGKQGLSHHADAHLQLMPQVMDLQARDDHGKIQMSGELLLTGNPGKKETVSMVTGMELGQEKKEEARPSVILMRCNQQRLWDMAKATGSTVEAIQAANGLDGQCEPGRMLLIPLKK